MPTLYDNFSQVRQYINQEKPDLTSYVTKTELANCSYVTSDVKELTGPLYITYQETNNALYGFKSYSHIVAGDENKTTPAFLASKRYCANGVGSYVNMASFFVNSDGRAKFGHKASAGGGGDDSFMCFNAYGFKVAYSGAAGTAATTEYEILHEGNIGNYITPIDENIIPKETGTYTLGDSSYKYNKVYSSRFVGGLSGDIYNTSNLIINIGNEDKYKISSDTIRPDSSNTNASLGTSDYKWAATYTSQVNVGNNSKMYNDNGGITFSINSNNGVRIGSSAIYPRTSGGFSLGSSSNVWNSAYITNAYISNYNNFIWQGTSAEYAALSDYTTYQLYLIENE